ncbi:MAG: Na+/H+ antiporter NhaA [Demequinaceae bacterium]|nr:Na+/H+ antiporter NhaA [Demequinaceae bacterium]
MVGKRRRRLFGRILPSTELVLTRLIRGERVGGILMLFATALALAWANSPLASSYRTLRETVPIDGSLALPGGRAIHLDLTLAQWAADGLLVIFFLVVGLELKREIMFGELRKPTTAVVPIVAAIGGVVVPAAIYLGVNAVGSGGSTQGWAIPTATDIAFALAILSVFGRRLPGSLRAFLLTLAVVDDLVAILIIAIFYSESIDGVWLVPAGVALWAIARCTSRPKASMALAIPLGLIVWLCVHESGIHATIAGVAIGVVVRAHKRPGERVSPVERWENRWGPVSALVAVPVFAFFAAGVALNGSALASAVEAPTSRGIALGLVIGKPLGIVLATFLVAGLTRASLPRGVSWWDVVGVATVAGIGFTVSLLISELAFGTGTVETDQAKAAVLTASAIAAIAGAAILAWRDRRHGEIGSRRGSPAPVEASHG